MGSSTGDKPSRWLARATRQFARTVYSELRRAGHDSNDVVRFVNEVMELLSRDISGGRDATLEPPALLDPEAGLPDHDTIQEILEFELGRCRQDRRQEKLVVVAIDVVLPSWASGSSRQRAHEALFRAVSAQLRATDVLGQLGPDRYLLIAVRAKQGVASVLRRRLQVILNSLAGELPDELALDVRWVSSDEESTSAATMIERCFAGSPVTLLPELQANAQAPAPPRPPAREKARSQQLVLALGGGAARAVSHAGVLRELRDARLSVAGVTGCSAGGLVGAMLARGVEPNAIVERFASFVMTPTYREMRRAYAGFLREARPPRGRGRSRLFGGSSLAFHSEAVLAAVPGDLLFAFVEYFVGGDRDIRALPIPFSVVATDLVEGRPVVLSHGSLHAALAASCAVPGLFPPQTIGERLLVDGSAVSEVPIWAARLLGVNAPVLAVHLTRPSHRVRDYQTSAEVASRSNALIHAELVREQLRRAEHLISVPVEGIGWLDFRQAQRIADIGQQAAREALRRILQRLGSGGESA